MISRPRKNADFQDLSPKALTPQKKLDNGRLIA